MPSDHPPSRTTADNGIDLSDDRRDSGLLENGPLEDGSGGPDHRNLIEQPDPGSPDAAPWDADDTAQWDADEAADPDEPDEADGSDEADDLFTDDADRHWTRPPLPRAIRWWVRSDVPLYLAALLFSAFCAAQALDLWSADLTSPFVYLNDATAVLAHFKTVIETGWYEYQPRLGAPGGQVYHDFPQADNLHMMAAWVLGRFTSNPALAVNVYYLIGFPLAALTSVKFFRVAGISKTVTLVLSVLFAIAPFHWEKGENHLFLAAYFPVPLALILVLRAIRGQRLWGFRAGLSATPRGRWRAALTGPGAATVAVMVLLGTASSYFSIFVMLLLGTAGLLGLVRSRRFRRFLGVVAAGAVLAATMFANMLPDLLYSLRYGNNVGALVRDDSESERYALKLAQLLLPAPDHQFKPFRQLRAWYDAVYPFVSERPALGLIAALGFLGLLGVLLVRVGAVASSRRTERPAAHPSAGPDGPAGSDDGEPVVIRRLTDRQRRVRDTLGQLAVLTLVAFLFSTMGGFETLVSFLTDSLRSWNRMSILIGAFSLAAFGLAVDALIRWVRRRPVMTVGRSRLFTAVLAATVLVVGVWDQSTLRAIPTYSLNQAQWTADDVWFGAMEDALPDGAMVFQLSYQPFPEAASVNGVIYTDALKPYLHTTTLRWSAGGMRGRAQNDWNALVAAEPVPHQIADLAAVGFEGILIDRRTYTDSGASTEGALARALGVAGPDMVSGSQRYSYFSLAPERARLATTYTQPEIDNAANSVLHPVFVYDTKDYTLGLNASRQVLWTSKEPTAPLTLDNARDVPVEIDLNMVVTSPTGATQVMITSGEQSWVVNLTASAASAFTLSFAAPPGRTELVLSPGPDALNVDGDTTFAVSNVSVIDVLRPDLGATATTVP